MGALRRIRRRLGRRRGPVAAGLAVAAVFGAAACEPGGGMGTAAVAITTDQAGTRELEKQGVDVQWLSCTASYGDKGPTTGNSPSVRSVATVDCVGEAKDGREITIKGKVTQEINGACVRGDLTAKVAGKQWFRADVLGNCAAGTPSTTKPSTTKPWTPPADHRTTPPADRPGATVTVTRTVTVSPHPTCSCFQGK
ncbi:hypothetical protein [Streptomyces sp. NBC_00878]|uniref:hypothetical protein n=1 Tax=Streptomyces sp. NBC_00878 TaxID=2975854 RepID=UPI00225AEE9B|nr:hypothetical protein [Streptomyces sp. NBC_00878]MCX4908757.1 hypothetical protein [Streptomyces sp. NBC_00878]